MPRKPTNSNTTSWSKDIAYQFGNTIPVIHKIPKGVELHHFNFHGACKDFQLAQAMAYQSKKFSNASDVLRAAMHIGLHILYHLTKIEDPEFAEKAGKILHLSSTMEQAFYRANVLDELVKDADMMKHCVKLGLLKSEEFESKLAELYSQAETTFDPGFSKMLQEMVGGLKTGKTPANLSTCKQHGGLRVQVG